jgi:adenosylcobinamide-phosphate synthase
LLVAAAAAVGPDPRGAWRILRRDAAKASSPNAGWPEAAMAGALGVRLGGPATYSGHRLDKPFIGDPPPISPLPGEKYRQAIRLLYAASLLMAAITFLSLLASGAGLWGILGWWR